MVEKVNGLKSKTLLGVPLALISLEVYFGVILGYFIGKFFAGKWTGQPQIVKSIIFHIGNYKLHIHHWLVSLGILISALLYNFFPFFPQFFCGFLGGLIVQDIYLDQDWYRILIKKK